MSKQHTTHIDVRKEQIALLRFEKQLIAMAETLAEGSATASSTDSKLNTREASASYNKMKKALQNLADITQDAHETLRNRAVRSEGRFNKFADELSKSKLSVETADKQVIGDKRVIGREVKSVLSMS